jgi:hypothetical protein
MGIYCPSKTDERLFQGEVLDRTIEWTVGYDSAKPDEVVGTEPRQHKLAVLLSQDCDLAQDWEKRKDELRIETDLKSVLLCPAFPADDLRQRQNLTSRRWETVRQNKDERYAYLAEIPADADAAGEGHPAILLDLSSYFTVRTVEIYRQLRTGGEDAGRRRCRLKTPWREHLQARFAGFLSRIGLPFEHFVPEGRRLQLPPQSNPAAAPA